MNITTTYRNVNGTPKVTAKGGGKQRTVAWDLSKSTDWNHGNAAGALLVGPLYDSIADRTVTSIMDGATHDQNDAGTVHRFTV